MSQKPWKAVNEYIEEMLVPDDPELESALLACDQAGLPPMSVLRTQGKFLHLLARIQNARAILEIWNAGLVQYHLACAGPSTGRSSDYT